MRELTDEEIGKVSGGTSPELMQLSYRFDLQAFADLKSEIDKQMQQLVEQLQRSLFRFGESDS